MILYASTDLPAHDASGDPNGYPPFKRLDSAVISRISDELDDQDLDLAAPSALVGALTRALCCPFFFCSGKSHTDPSPDINRLSLSSPLVDPRILVLSVSPDLSTAYIPIMNAIFSAQKLVFRDF